MVIEPKKKHWYIRAYDGANLIYEKKALYGQITEKSMQELLRVLVAKLSLDEDEIIKSYAKKRTKIYQNHLQVIPNTGGKYGFMCGDNPHVIAVVE
jgi:hypothetical protein